MTKRRTRKQKEQAKHQYSLVGDYSTTAPAVIGSSPTNKSNALSAFDLYEYDTHLIRQDLLKTLIISSIILIIEFAIYFIYFK